MRSLFSVLAASLFMLLVAPSAGAQAQKTVPYWASIRASEVNMRVGPGSEFRVVWIYRRPGLPFKVLRVREGWRLVEDPGGMRGWVAGRLLSPERTVVVVGKNNTAMRVEPITNSGVRWWLQPGVVGLLQDCSGGWCRVDVRGHRGWVQADRLWGDEAA